jgi:hypothetical protein
LAQPSTPTPATLSYRVLLVLLASFRHSNLFNNRLRGGCPFFLSLLPQNNSRKLYPRVSNLATLMEHMVQNQRELSVNQQLLTTIVQRQAEEIQLLRQIVQNHEEDKKRSGSCKDRFASF